METDFEKLNMKKIFIGLTLLMGVSLFAQEAGKAGELLRNEASTSEMQSQNSSGFRNKTFERNSGNQNNRIKNPSYQWNRNYGYAEVFLRVPEQGFFTVEVGDQMIANGSGKFRFF